MTWDQGTNSHATWSAIQVRAGLPRSEWTFGHSIALGNVMAACIPFVMTLRKSWPTKAVLLTLVAAGIAVTLSRNAIISGLLTVGLVTLLLGPSIGRRAKEALLWAMPVVVVLGWAGLSSLGSSSGAETGLSTQARVTQWQPFNDVRLLGVSDAATVLADGSLGFWTAGYSRGFTSTIDNAILLIALRSGALVATLVLGVLLWVAVSQLRHRYRNAAGVAVLCQLFTIATTALITYYSVVVWILVGIAVSVISRRKAAADQPVAPAAGAVGIRR